TDFLRVVLAFTTAGATVTLKAPAPPELTTATGADYRRITPGSFECGLRASRTLGGASARTGRTSSPSSLLILAKSGGRRITRSPPGSGAALRRLRAIADPSVDVAAHAAGSSRPSWAFSQAVGTRCNRPMRIVLISPDLAAA